MAKDSKVYTVEFDKKRLFTFDYNALEVVQETYDDPFKAFAALDELEKTSMIDLKAIKTLIYACLVAGSATKDLDLNISKNTVGRILGELMMKDQEKFQALLEAMAKSIVDFLPEQPPVEEAEGNSKN